jgi:hypothetical protein
VSKGFFKKGGWDTNRDRFQHVRIFKEFNFFSIEYPFLEAL